MNRLNKTESDVFLYCRFSLFLKDPFFPNYFKTNYQVLLYIHFPIKPLGAFMSLSDGDRYPDSPILHFCVAVSLKHY